MNLRDTLLELVKQALEELDKSDIEIVSSIHKGIRIARMTKDWENLLWLRMTIKNVNDQVTKREIWDEIRPHFDAESLQELNKKNGQILLSLRRIEEGKVAGFSIQETIQRIKKLEKAVDTAYIDQSADIATATINLRGIVYRTKNRLYDYLTKLEANLISGSIESDPYIDNKLFVIEELKGHADTLLEQLREAENNINSSNTEKLSHSALSCRRAIKSIADYLYKVDSPQKIKKGDKTIELSDEKFINRLWQFLYENLDSKSTRKVLEEEIKSIGNRLEQINSMSSKGVHDYLNASEVKGLVMRTYILIGDLLRIKKEKIHEGDLDEEE